VAGGPNSLPYIALCATESPFIAFGPGFGGSAFAIHIHATRPLGFLTILEGKREAYENSSPYLPPLSFLPSCPNLSVILPTYP